MFRGNNDIRYYLLEKPRDVISATQPEYKLLVNDTDDALRSIVLSRHPISVPATSYVCKTWINTGFPYAIEL